MKLTRILFILLTSFATLLSGVARGENSAAHSCWPEFTSVNLDVQELSGKILFPYLSRNVSGTYVTEVQGELLLNKNKLSLTAAYSEGWGLPFVIYAVMVLKESKMVWFEDFSRGCQSPGLNLFPGDRDILVEIKDIPSNIKDLKVIIWAQ